MYSVEGEFHLPAPGILVHLSSTYTPAHLVGMVIHPDNALQFDFLIHRGDEPLNEIQKQEQYTKLVKYFLASLTVPDNDQWVNLSPYEKNRIIKDDFGKTEMGRDLLAQDYILKQITSSLIYPEDNLGKKFWNRVYERAFKEYGVTNIPVNTFNKVWIIPDEAAVYESGNTVYVLRNHLKVMLEEDYLSLQKHSGTTNNIHSIGSQVIREIVLPELEREVNEGKNFANLRQIYSGMILATWYKHALKESLLGKVYANQAKVQGVTGFTSNDPGVIASEAKQSQHQIYQQYLKAFKKGVFNYIKEDVDKYTKEAIPRKYFSGGAVKYSGIDNGMHGYGRGILEIVNNKDMSLTISHSIDRSALVGDIDRAAVSLETDKEADAAMNSIVANSTAENLVAMFRKYNDLEILFLGTNTAAGLINEKRGQVEAVDLTERLFREFFRWSKKDTPVATITAGRLIRGGIEEKNAIPMTKNLISEYGDIGAILMATMISQGMKENEAKEMTAWLWEQKQLSTQELMTASIMIGAKISEAIAIRTSRDLTSEFSDLGKLEAIAGTEATARMIAKGIDPREAIGMARGWLKRFSRLGSPNATAAATMAAAILTDKAQVSYDAAMNSNKAISTAEYLVDTFRKIGKDNSDIIFLGTTTAARLVNKRRGQLKAGIMAERLISEFYHWRREETPFATITAGRLISGGMEEKDAILLAKRLIVKAGQVGAIIMAIMISKGMVESKAKEMVIWFSE